VHAIVWLLSMSKDGICAMIYSASAASTSPAFSSQLTRLGMIVKGP
jgi:hypothetical protein